ncbi:hypothetical protein CSV79_15920 [Sporosarcina sp. P13]|uniref:hypothetical protein n=1 Tax=Sporosarcina sp. P13 TaxID=2048263 RepID=UPI000C166F32|nr:hypothetical protein [Sporosarcina sp. P13]PIC62642.1 hypothetical protein CSV79_15920 [Sporosarcina sp. P13]
MNKSSFLLLVSLGILICELNYGTVIANPKDTSPYIRESVTEVGYKSAIEVMKGYFKDINEGHWAKVDKWFVKEESYIIKGFLDDKENQEKKLGLLNIRKARLVDWKELPYDYARNYVPSRNIDQYRDKKVFYVAVDYKVYHENEYNINGVNYFFVVLVLEDNKWKIASIPLVPVKSIIFDGYGFGTEDEKAFDVRRLKFHIN